MQFDRRTFLAMTAAACGISLAGAAGQMVIPPLLSGALQQYNHDMALADGLAGWKHELDAQQRLGFDLLWLANLGGALQAKADLDPLLGLMDLAGERSMTVLLDVGSSPGWYTSLDVAAERAAVRKNIQIIKDRYAGHPAFKGWYIPHEIYMAWGPFGDYMNDLYPALVEACKEAVPGAPVSLSPFFILDQDKIFGDFRYAAPEEYGNYWAELIRRSEFDIIMLQDSGEHFSFVTNAQREPFYAAMQRACREGGAALWGNVECAEFECPSIEEYVRRYGRVHHGTVPYAPWRAVPMPRMQEKLELAARYCERLVTWGYQEYGRPSASPASAKWYSDYAEHRNAVLARKP